METIQKNPTQQTPETFEKNGWRELFAAAAMLSCGLKSLHDPCSMDGKVFVVDEGTPLFVCFRWIGVKNLAVQVCCGRRDFADWKFLEEVGEDAPLSLLIARKSCLVCYYGPPASLLEGDFYAMYEGDYEPETKDDVIYFRSYRRGCAPWPLSSPDLPVLQVALTQAALLLEDLALGKVPDNDGYPCRQYDGAGAFRPVRFHNEDIAVEPEPLMNDLQIARARKCPCNGHCIELDCIYIPTPMMVAGSDRLVFPCLLLLADHDDGQVLEQKVLSPDEDPDETMLVLLLEQFQSIGRPRLLLLRDPESEPWLIEFCKQLHIQFSPRLELEVIDDFVDMLSCGELPEDE